MKNKNTEEIVYDILTIFALFLGVSVGLIMVMMVAYLIGALIGTLIKAAGGIAFAAIVIFIVLAATITYLIRKHFLI